MVETLAPDSPLWTFEPTAIVVSRVGQTQSLFHELLWNPMHMKTDQQLQMIEAIVDGFRRSIQRIRERLDVPILLLGHPLLDRPGMGPAEQSWLGALSQRELRHQLALAMYSVAKEFDRCAVIDTEVVLARQQRHERLIGSELLGEHFRPTGGLEVASEISQLIRTFDRSVAKVKVVAVDLDNTMWHGVIREDGAEGVSVRHANARALKVLLRRGILLAVCSKNDPDVADQLPKLLGRDISDSLVAVSLGWEPKSVRLKKMAADLGLGVDSIALFDDNEHERAEVSMNAPEIRVFADTEIVECLSWPDFSPSDRPTELTQQRTQQYQQRAARNASQPVESNPDELARYYESLEMELTLEPMAPTQRDRVNELFARTNQLNASAQRTLIAADTDLSVLTCSLRDKFGDFGLVGAAAFRVSPESPQHVDIEEFALSCRAMGFGIERAMMSQVIATSASQRASTVQLKLVATDRNAEFRRLIAQMGFDTLNEDTVARTLDEPLEAPTWLQIVTHDREHVE